MEKLNNDIIEQARNGDRDALEKIYNHYFELINKIIDYLHTKYDNYLLEDDDLRQVAYFGIIKCLQSNTNFYKTIYWHILNAIQRELMNNGRSVRIPINVWEKYYRIDNINDDISNKTNSEFIERTRPIDINELDIYTTYDNIKIVEDNIYKNQISEQLLYSIKSILTEKEYKVITLYYFERKSMKEIAMELNLSRNRIGQIKNKALYKLKFNRGFRKLFYNN